MQNVKLENLLLIDIETVPFFSSFDKLSLDWQHLWEEKVNKILPQNITAAAFYNQRAGVMAEFAKIICISIGYFLPQNNNLQLRIKSFYGDDEKLILNEFVKMLHQINILNKNTWSFAGHNIKEFDIPFICRRLIMNQLSIPSFLDFQNVKPWNTNTIDTFQYWRFGDYKNFTSLKLLAAALNVPTSKDDIDGSMVADVYWQDRDIERIVTYCQKDVITTGNVICRFKNIELLQPEQIIIVK